MSDHVASVQALFVKHSASLRGFVASLLSDFAAVDDVMQDTFLTVTEKATQFEMGTNFVAWAKAIARYKVIESRRAHWREVPGLGPEAIDALCASEPEDDSSLLEARLRALRQCIGELAPQTRRAVELRYQNAHTAEETARLMQWTVPSLYVMLHRAREGLARCVQFKLADIAS